MCVRSGISDRAGRQPARRTPRPRSGQQGAAAIEFAILLTPLILVLSAIAEIGLILLMQGQLRLAVATTAREIRLNTINGTASSRICAVATLLADCNTKLNVDIQSAANFATLSTAMATDPVNLPTYNVTMPAVGQASSLIATYDWDFIFPALRIFSNVPGKESARRLFAVAVFRRQT